MTTQKFINFLINTLFYCKNTQVEGPNTHLDLLIKYICCTYNQKFIFKSRLYKKIFTKSIEPTYKDYKPRISILKEKENE